MTSRTASSLGLALALMLLQACGGSKSDTDLIASAKTYLAANDRPAAIIQLKNALQKQPENGEARYLLGKALLDGGDPASASLELRKAAQAGHDEALVAPLLARALLVSGDDKSIIERFAATTLKDKTAQGELQATVGMAYSRQGDTAKAAQALKQALEAAPTSAWVRMFNARMSAQKQDFAAALTELDAVTTQDPANAEAWLLKGQIQAAKDTDPSAALASFRKAAAARADSVPAHEGIMLALLRQNDVAGATAEVAEMKKLLPRHPRTLYFEAHVAYLNKDFAATREITQRLLQTTPNDAAALELAGAAEFRLQSFARAETLLAQATQIDPKAQLSRLLLARIYLRAGNAAKSMAVLKPMLDQPQPNAQALAAAGESQLMNGDTAASEAYFKRAAAARPEDARIRTELAISQLGKPGAGGEQALADLGAIAASDSGVLANLAMISEHMRNKRFDKALKAVDELEKKEPGKPLAADLRGRVKALANDPAGARASFERALKIDPVYFPATLGLAALDLSEQKPARARQRFDDLLRIDPKNAQAALALVTLLARTGAGAPEITALLVKAVADNPTLPEPRLRLVDQHLANGDPKLALATARDGALALPANGDILFSLARAQLAAGELQQAVTSLNQLAALEPTSPRAQLGLADVNLGLKDRAAAVRSLQRALEISPGLVAAQRKLIELAVADQRLPDALDTARQVKKQHPQAAIGYLLEGRLEATRKNWDAAITLYRAGLQKEKSSELAIELHKVLFAADKRAEADKFAAAWDKERPGDGIFAFYLGDAAMAARNFPEAEARYRLALKAQPRNALAMNNVAWLLLKQGKPGALAMAQQANELIPKQPPLMDTLATALAADNQTAKALEVQQQAAAAAPNDASIRLNLAKLLIQAGDKPKARAELEALSKLGSGFGGQPEVAALLAKL